jgi:peptidoglycan/LPS O-acetylase OafA/YrhL
LKFDRPTAYRHALLACCLAAQAAIGGLESALIVAAFFALFYAFSHDRLGWIVSRPLVFLGSISYALYVLHHPLGNVVMINLQRVTGSPVLLIGAAVGVTVLASMAVTRYVEKPAMASIRRIAHKREASAGLGPRGQFVMFNCPRLSRWHMSEIHRAS